MTETLIDTEVLDQLIATTDAAFVEELLGAFLDDSPQLIAAMQQALADDNAEAFRRAAHTLKSNSASFGAVNLAALAKELEMIGKTGRLDGAGDALERLAAEYDRAERALQEWQHGS
jgi:HPt (histidine-containing phosphotransfer) domain-containing protein